MKKQNIHKIELTQKQGKNINKFKNIKKRLSQFSQTCNHFAQSS